MVQSRDTTREVQGASWTWEGVFPLKLDTNPCISLWMNCAPGCHTRTEVISCPPGRSQLVIMECSKGVPWRHSGAGVGWLCWESSRHTQEP